MKFFAQNFQILIMKRLNDMRIKNINNDNVVTPIHNLQQHISSMSSTANIEQLNSAETAASTYLAALKDTQYITTRESFEYARTIREKRHAALEAFRK
jgi:hypothetical protein